MDENRIIQKINQLTEGYKGEDKPTKRLEWLRHLVNAYKRYLPSRVIDKIKVDPVAKHIEGERRTITVVFADLSGFTSLSETMDPEDIANIINDFFTRMLDIVFKYEGSVDKFLGDALMVLFGAPIAHHDDPERAVRAALEMQATMNRFNTERKLPQPLSMSIGINTGPAVALNVGSEKRMEYTVIGDTVNLSARLEKVASAGEIIISHNTHQYITDVVDAEKKPSVRVKGKRKPVKIYLVHDMREHYKLPDITKLQLIGREEEIQKIESIIQQIKQDKGAIIGLVGDPGVGKSRLALEAQILGGKKQLMILKARCMPYQMNTPYTTIKEILCGLFQIKPDAKEEEIKLRIGIRLKNQGITLEQALPYIGLLFGFQFPEMKKLPPEQIKQRIFETIKKILYTLAKENPLFIRIEDLQWSDPTSQELFDYLVKDLSKIPIIILFEYRSDFTFPWLTLPYCTSFILRNLSQQQTKQYIKRILNLEIVGQEVVKLVYNKSQGNPLFVQEIVKYLLKKGGIRRKKGKTIITSRLQKLEIAESIAGIILAQIDRMSEEDRHTLQYASVIGKIFQPSLLSKIINISEENLRCDLERLEHFEGILTSHQDEDEKQYEFLSPTTYEVIYSSLFKKRRKELHMLVGQVLEQRYFESLLENSEQLAYHFVRSSNPSQGIRYAKLAADKSFHLYSLKESNSYLQQALELIGKKDLTPEQMQDRLEVLRRQGFILRLLGQLNDALLKQKRSLRLAHKMKSLTDEAGACLNIGIVYQEMGIPQKGLNYWTRARRIAKKIGDQRIYILSVNNLGAYYLHTGNLKMAYDNFTKALSISTQIKDEKGIALANLNLGNVTERKRDFPKALEHYTTAHTLFEKLGEKENVAHCLNMIGTLNLSIGNIEESMRKFNQSVALATEIGDKATESLALGNIGIVHAQMWQLDKAQEKFSQSLTIAQMIGEASQNMNMTHNIGDVYQFQGNIKSAREYHSKAIDIAVQIKAPLNEAIARRALGWDLLYAGEYNKAAEQFGKSQGLFNQAGDRRNGILSLIGIAATKRQSGIHQEALAIVTDLISKAREIKDPEILALSLDIKGDVHIDHNDYNKAGKTLAEIPDLSRKIGNKRLYAWTLGKMAYLAGATGKMEESHEYLEKSIALAQEIGDSLLLITNLLTKAQISIVKTNMTDGLNTLKQTIEKARQCGSLDLIARTLWLTSHIFKQIGKEQERQSYLTEYHKTIDKLTREFSQQEKTRYMQHIETLMQ